MSKEDVVAALARKVPEHMAALLTWDRGIKLEPRASSWQPVSMSFSAIPQPSVVR